jgi:hypothetical protein
VDIAAAPLIVQVPSQGKLERRLRESKLPGVPDGALVIEAGATDDHGVLEALDVGEVVVSVPSPETLTREPGEVREVIAQAGPGSEPLVIEIEAAEELTGKELAVLLEAAASSSRAVLVRIVREV